ncbi:hypothetical protein X777_05154 [Ooceraea biroi]|uniref:Uncharacterized protein n=1 Tax=Ooceraea biroi TaxID=2015173 RepID=A0A026WGX0_OOCBI|nr:hypothetical protein X777_05154 [Ooceraea biroi]
MSRYGPIPWPARSPDLTPMKAKTKLGMGLRSKRRSAPVGSLIGGAAGVAKAVNDSKATRRQLEELQRHSHAMEGRGLYLAPHARGRGTKKKKNVPVSARIATRRDDRRAASGVGRASSRAVLQRGCL